MSWRISGDQSCFSACYDDQTPWLAVQDGAGPWTRVRGNANQYTFTLTCSTAAVASATSSGLTVLRLATSEMAPWAARPCDPDAPDKLILGSAVNMPPNSEGYASLGGDDITFTSVDPTFTLEFVPPGTYDLWGYARSSATMRPTSRRQV